MTLKSEDIITLLQDYVDVELTAIHADSRFHDKPALVQINAPLALIQVELKTIHQVLTKIKSILKG